MGRLEGWLFPAALHSPLPTSEAISYAPSPNRMCSDQHLRVLLPSLSWGTSQEGLARHPYSDVPNTWHWESISICRKEEWRKGGGERGKRRRGRGKEDLLLSSFRLRQGGGAEGGLTVVQPQTVAVPALTRGLELQEPWVSGAGARAGGCSQLCALASNSLILYVLSSVGRPPAWGLFPGHCTWVCVYRDSCTSFLPHGCVRISLLAAHCSGLTHFGWHPPVWRSSRLFRQTIRGPREGKN